MKCLFYSSILFRVIPVMIAGGLLAGEWAIAQDIPYSVGSWARELGNHRARVQVDQPGEAVRVHLPWRRRDADPEKKAVYVVDAATGERVRNVVAPALNREAGDVLFQPKTVPGIYDVYYMPYQHAGPPHEFRTEYAPPQASADQDWLGRHGLTPEAIAKGGWRDLPQASLIEFQARSEFDRVDPMEIIATREETQALLERHPDDSYLLFPEDRRYPIRMTQDLPLRWIQKGPGSALRGAAQPGEFYVFQVGVYAARAAIEDIDVAYSGLRGETGAWIPAASFRCFNLGGRDWLGRPMTKTFRVEQGTVRALWFGVQVSEDLHPGAYTGSVALQPAGMAPTEIALGLDVAGTILEDAGDRELWRHSRLRWLDSTIGLDDGVVAPYTPLTAEGDTVSCLGRSVRFGETAYIESIQSWGREILAAPVTFSIETANGAFPWPPRIAEGGVQTPGSLAWRRNGTSGPMSMCVQSNMEFDGYINCRITLQAKEDLELGDARLEIPLRRDIATYMMGMGRKGGYRPASWEWRWDPSLANNSLWIGDAHAGLHCKLKDPEDRWELYRLGEAGLPDAWHNGGRGTCTVTEEGDDRVVVRAASGPRQVKAGQELVFCFGLLTTPLKPLDARHWGWRYYHRGGDPDLNEAANVGASIINIHQGGALNPYINYPFLTTDPLSAYVRAAHEKNLKVKIYYTVRELSNHTAELFALRSLGHEIFSGGAGGGASWLHEHLASDYAAAWHEANLPNGEVDAALGTTSLSRWHNYYLEGLRWLLENVEIDGLYLDGIGYNREIMKRVRKVMERSRPGSLIDFHSGNNFHPQYGLSNCANQYLEHFPYIDSLWFGEGFDYNESPDYWLVEVSGIPFGLYGEMLQGGGNPWRGMLYGMTSRFGWGGDPRPIWEVWDDFGIAEAVLCGYWDPACPVRTGREDVLATAYCKKGQALIALASWAQESAECRLDIQWKALRLQPEKAQLYAPEIPGFQPEAVFRPDEPIPVEPGRGWLLLLRAKQP